MTEHTIPKVDREAYRKRLTEGVMRAIEEASPYREETETETSLVIQPMEVCAVLMGIQALLLAGTVAPQPPEVQQLFAASFASDLLDKIRVAAADPQVRKSFMARTAREAPVN
jgi:hypothetical protein